jgi:hypothetical protein
MINIKEYIKGLKEVDLEKTLKKFNLEYKLSDELFKDQFIINCDSFNKYETIKIVDHHLDIINWEYFLMNYKYLTIEFIYYFYNKLNSNKFNIGWVAMSDHENEIEFYWESISYNAYISIDILEEFEDKMNWSVLSRHYPFNANSIDKFSNRIDFIELKQNPLANKSTNKNGWIKGIKK